MDFTQLKQAIEKLPPEALTRSILVEMASRLESLSSSSATLHQELDTLKVRPPHVAGLCDDEGCRPCRNVEIAMGQQAKDDIIVLFETAANRYGLQAPLATLAEAVKQHRAGNTAWRPGYKVTGDAIEPDDDLEIILS